MKQMDVIVIITIPIFLISGKLCNMEVLFTELQ